jgi:hypothetical protein
MKTIKFWIRSIISLVCRLVTRSPEAIDIWTADPLQLRRGQWVTAGSGADAPRGVFIKVSPAGVIWVDWTKGK